MSDAPQPSSSSSFGRVTLVVIPLALIGWAATIYSRSLQSTAQVSLERTMATRLLGDNGATKLSSKLRDADGDLLADPPAEAEQLLDAQEINFSYVSLPAARNTIKRPGRNSWQLWNRGWAARCT